MCLSYFEKGRRVFLENTVISTLRFRRKILRSALLSNGMFALRPPRISGSYVGVSLQRIVSKTIPEPVLKVWPLLLGLGSAVTSSRSEQSEYYSDAWEGRRWPASGTSLGERLEGISHIEGSLGMSPSTRIDGQEETTFPSQPEAVLVQGMICGTVGVSNSPMFESGSI